MSFNSGKMLTLVPIIFFFFTLMVIFSFPDLFALFYVPNMISEGNIYSLVAMKKNACPWLDATYPPLYYLTIGGYLKLIQYLGLVQESLFTSSVCPIWTLVLNKSFLFWVKFPFLLFHIASGYVFSLLFKKRQFLWLLLWLLNPVAIFINFIEGQFEIIPSFFIILAIYLAKKNKSFFSLLSLGVGGAYKHFPFLLVLPFSLILGGTPLRKGLLILTSLIPYLLSAPFLFNQNFLTSLSFSENYKMLNLNISLGGIKISIYLVLYLLLTLKMMLEKQKNFDTLIKYSSLFTLIYFITSFWFVQRLLFLLPSLLVLASKRKSVFNSLPLLYFGFFLYALFMFPGIFDHTLLRPLASKINPIDLYPLFTLSEHLGKQTISFAISGIFLWLGYLGLTRFPKEEVIITRQHILFHVSGLVFYLTIISILSFISIA